MNDWSAVRAVLTRGCADRVFPGAAAEVGTSAGVRWREVAGATHYDARGALVDERTVYDLASLTKVIATTSIALRLVDAGRLDLERRIAAVVPRWNGNDRSGVSVADLLEHASGLPDWRPLFRSARGVEAFVAAIATTPLSYPPRSTSVYSDLGFILLGHVLEHLGEAGLDVLTASALAEGPGDDLAERLTFGLPAARADRVAPTAAADERGVLVPGDVDDTNAWAMGGIAGHAGLFGDVVTVGRFASWCLAVARSERPSGRPVKPATVSRFLRPSTVPGSSRALGWDLMRRTSSCGTRMSAAAFGHTGFTGTSIWIDPAADVYCVLLTNRVHPEPGDPERIRQVRRAFHDAVMATLSA